LGTAGFSDGEADYVSLAVDANGTSYVAYSDVANSNKATVMKFVNGAWTTVGTSGFSADEADYTSLTIDANGVPYVAFSDYANSKKSHRHEIYKRSVDNGWIGRIFRW